MDNEIADLKHRIERLEHRNAALFQLAGNCAVTTHAVALTTRRIGAYLLEIAEPKDQLSLLLPLLERLDAYADNLEAALRAYPDE